MANTWYPWFKHALLRNWTGDLISAGTSIKVVMIDLADYTYSATHSVLSEVPSAARVGTTVALTGKTTTNGLLRADNINMPSAPGDQFEAMIIFIDTGVESTSRLMLYLDTFTSGMPFTLGPVAGLHWSSSGIAQL